MGRQFEEKSTAGRNGVLTSKEFQTKFGKRKSLRKKTNAEINREMTASFLSQCEEAGLPCPLMEFKFDPERKWRVDFLFVTDFTSIMPYIELAVEIEGYGHNKPKMYFKDLEKYNELTFAGIKLLRFTVKQVKDGFAVKQIKRIL